VTGGERGIEIAERLGQASVSAGEDAHRLAATDARQFESQRLVAEGRHVEMTASEARVPGQSDGAQSTAEADSGIAEVSSEFGEQIEQGRDTGPEVVDTAGEDIAVRILDVVQHMPVGIFRDGRTAAQAQAAEAGNEIGGVRARQIQRGPLDPAVAVAQDQPESRRLVLRGQEPATDPDAVGGVVFQVVDTKAGMGEV
jgi:hypothetical protein